MPQPFRNEFEIIFSSRIRWGWSEVKVRLQPRQRVSFSLVKKQPTAAYIYMRVSEAQPCAECTS